MPALAAAGRMGAIHAASRQRRQQKVTISSKRPSSPKKSFLKGLPSVRDEPPFSSCATGSSISVDSKPSMMTQVKQQVQETSCTLKKYRQAFSKNVAKGLKMVSGTTSTNKDMSESDQLAAIEAKPVSSTSSDPAWLRSVEQMGFSRSEVLEAAGSLSDQPSPSEIDDLVQVLLVMSTSRAASTCDVPVDILHAPAQAGYTTLPEQPLPPLSPPPTELATAPLAITPQAYLKMPPMPAMSAVGSAEFEMAVNKDTVLHAKPPPTQANVPQCSLLQSPPPTLPLATSLALEQMGFASEAIQEAGCLLGPAAQFEDLVDLLSNQASRRGGSSVSACPAATRAVQESDAFQNRLLEEMLEEMRKASGEASIDSEEEEAEDFEVFDDSTDAMQEQSSEDHRPATAVSSGAALEQDAHEVSSRSLATTVVAMVLASVSEKMVLQMGEKNVANKKVVDEPFPASPKRGGA